MPVPTFRVRACLVVLTFALPLASACASEGDGSGNQLEVTGTNDLTFEPGDLEAQAGTLEVELTAEDGARHTFTLADPFNEDVAAAEAGQTATGTVEVEPGEYVFYCSVAGHRDAGMEGVLTVSG